MPGEIDDMVCRGCGKRMEYDCIENGVFISTSRLPEGYDLEFGEGDIYKCECGRYTVNGFSVKVTEKKE